MTTSLLSHLQQLLPTPPVVAAGKLVRGIGLTLEAVGCQLPVGSQCMVQTVDGEIEAEVVGFGEHITGVWLIMEKLFPEGRIAQVGETFL